MSNDEEPDASRGAEILPASTWQETSFNAAATLVAAAPVLGGPLSNIFSGLSAGRRFQRIRVVILELEKEIDDLSEEQAEYVRGEDFEDLLRETLERVSNERLEAKRRLYRDFLFNVIRESAGDYDERFRFLRILEQLQLDHFAVLRAMDQPPGPEEAESVLAGSRMNTLRGRLPEVSNEHLDDLVTELGDLRITSGSLGGMVTGPSAVNLRPLITPFGHRLLEFIRQPDDETDA
jgi:hypothetical protein